jgi:hypothetical protein
VSTAVPEGARPQFLRSPRIGAWAYGPPGPLLALTSKASQHRQEKALKFLLPFEDHGVLDESLTERPFFDR